MSTGGKIAALTIPDSTVGELVANVQRDSYPLKGYKNHSYIMISELSDHLLIKVVLIIIKRSVKCQLKTH